MYGLLHLYEEKSWGTVNNLLLSVFLTWSDRELNYKVEGTLHDAYWSRHVSHWVQSSWICRKDGRRGRHFTVPDR